MMCCTKHSFRNSAHLDPVLCILISLVLICAIDPNAVLRCAMGMPLCVSVKSDVPHKIHMRESLMQSPIHTPLASTSSCYSKTNATEAQHVLFGTSGDSRLSLFLFFFERILQ